MQRALILHPDELKTICKILGGMNRPQMRVIGKLDVYEEEVAVLLHQKLAQEYPNV